MSTRLNCILLPCRHSSWISATTRTSGKRDIDVEKTFINKNVQSLLYKLTGLDLHGKVFRERNIRAQQRSHYALMTNTMFEDAVKKMETRGRKFLQFVPVKEPRANTSTVLSTDVDIAGFDQSNLVFTDITFDVTNRNRLVVVRKTDGTLRTALPEERDRMNRVYYEQRDRPVMPPALFDEARLEEALSMKKHEFVLDWACYFYEPDDAKFVEISKYVFDQIAKTEQFNLLRSTRHFGPMMFYLVLNEQLPPLLRFFGGTGSLHDVATVIKLHQMMFPDWKRGETINTPDRKVVEQFVKQNKRYKMPELVALLEGRTNESTSIKNDRNYTEMANQQLLRKHAAVSSENLQTSEGPLGELSDEYKVRLESGDRAPQSRLSGQSRPPPRRHEHDGVRQQRRQPSRPRGSDGDGGGKSDGPNRPRRDNNRTPPD